MLEFSPELVKVVDRVGPNTLIRGPMPLRADESFAYEDIAQATGLDLTQKTFVDISLIDCTGEHMFLAAEMAAFGLTAPEPSYWPPFLQPDYHPSKGTPSTLPGGHPAKFFWWPIEGIGAGADPTPMLYSPGYNFAGLVGRLTQLMYDPSPKNVYIHCMLGADRTGALHGGYLLKKQEPLSRVLQLIDCTPAHLPNVDYIRLIEAYAASLPI